MSVGVWVRGVGLGAVGWSLPVSPSVGGAQLDIFKCDCPFSCSRYFSF